VASRSAARPESASAPLHAQTLTLRELALLDGVRTSEVLAAHAGGFVLGGGSDCRSRHRTSSPGFDWRISTKKTTGICSLLQVAEVGEPSP
jgi:hypothetical protein